MVTCGGDLAAVVTGSAAGRSTQPPAPAMLGRVALATLSSAAVALARVPSDSPNMNGGYIYWRTPDAPTNRSFPTNLMSYPGGVESFDAYHGPINSTYGQVWWTSSSDALPEAIIQRFKGKVMAIVAVEMDQVRRKGDKDIDGSSILQEDISVPINVAYRPRNISTCIRAGG